MTQINYNLSGYNNQEKSASSASSASKKLIMTSPPTGSTLPPLSTLNRKGAFTGGGWLFLCNLLPMSPFFANIAPLLQGE